MIEKICFVLLSAIIVAVLARPSDNGNFQISKDTNGRIICDKLTCPDNTERCVIKSKTDETRENITTVWQCIGENDEVLLEDKSTVKNPDPTNEINTHMESGNKASPEMQKHIDEVNDDIAKSMEEMKNHFNNMWKHTMGSIFN